MTDYYLNPQMPEKEFFPDTPFELLPNIVLLGRRGSEAHGTYLAPTDPNGIDDRDLMGIVIPPKDYYIGMKHWDHAEAIKGVWDIVLYEFRKFVSLLCKQNPNVLSLLYLEPDDYIVISPVGRWLIDRRSKFCAREAAYQAFIGYAHGQLHKMMVSEFKGFMGAKRKALVEKFGYDVKNAAHLVRLLHMGEEYLREGTLHVRRTQDVEMILDIKRGKWTLDRVRAYADEMFARCRNAKDQSALPESIDEESINQLVAVSIAFQFECMDGLSLRGTK